MIASKSQTQTEANNPDVLLFIRISMKKVINQHKTTIDVSKNLYRDNTTNDADFCKLFYY